VHIVQASDLRPQAGWKVVANAAYATPVLADGSRAGAGAPFTSIGFLLYAQAEQADGSTYRNILVAHQGAKPVNPRETREGFVFQFGSAEFQEQDICQTLKEAGLLADAPLSVLAVEFYPPGGSVAQGVFPEQGDPAGTGATGAAFDPFDPENFGKRRILRTSTLTKIAPYC
jgi:hypothetical protein